MATSKIIKSGTLNYKAVDFSIPSTQIAGDNYSEIRGIDIAQTGWIPISLTRVYTNRSNAVLCGFVLSQSTNKVNLMVKNVSPNAVVMDSGSLTVCYIQV